MSGATADISAELGAARDQGPRGTCLAFAASAVHEQARLRRRGEPRPELGEELLYWRCKQLDGNREDGTSVDSAHGALKQPGQSAAELWPYDGNRDSRASVYAPPEAALDTSVLRRATLSEITASAENIRSQLQGGRPVLLAIRLWHQFFGDHRGVLNAPSPQQLIPGGHAVVAVGFDEDAGWFLIRNSWGNSWGLVGHAQLPEAALKTIILGGWTIEDDIDD